MPDRLYEQTLYRMCGIAGIKQSDYAHREAVLDTVFLAGDDGLEDVLFFHIFGSMASKYAISMKVRPKPCSVEISVFS